MTVKQYTPFKNDKLMNTKHINDLNNLKHSFNHYIIFELNFSFVNVSKD